MCAVNLLHDQSLKHCLQKIKQELKAKGITYTKIAKAMEVSEITVKRMLNQSDISVKKLMALADLSECDLSELIKDSQKPSQEYQCFTKKQDESFCKYPHLFQFYVYLIHFEMQPQDIAKKFKLDITSTNLYLNALEKLRLIKLQPDQTVRIPKNPHISFAQDSMFVRSYLLDSLQKISSQYRMKNPDQGFALATMWFRSEDMEKIYEELVGTMSKYAIDLKESFLNRRVKPDYQLILAGMPNRPIPEVELVKLKLGDLKV